MESLVHGNELDFVLRLGICLVLGTAVGVERELRNKPAGISTNCFVMAGACLFTFISQVIDPSSPARVAAQVVSGVGFLGAGMILKAEPLAADALTKLGAQRADVILAALKEAGIDPARAASAAPANVVSDAGKPVPLKLGLATT